MQTSNNMGWLEAIVTRPGMYVGDSGDFFQSVCTFLGGIELFNSPMLKPEDRKKLANIIPPHFHEFVKEEFGISASNSMGWQTVVKNNTKTDYESLNLLLELRKKYDQSKWEDKKTEDS